MTESPNTTPTRAAIYVRTATTDRLTLCRIEEQERRCREAIAERLPDCIVADECVFRDSGGPCLNGRRPALEELLKKAKMNPCPFDVVVVASSDRIGRNMSVVSAILHSLHSKGVTIYFADMTLDQSRRACRSLTQSF